MKAKKINKLRKKYTCTDSVQAVANSTAGQRQQSPFHGLSHAEGLAEFEQMLKNGIRWVDSDEYRKPAPLGPIRVEFDEDGVPTYLY